MSAILRSYMDNYKKYIYIYMYNFDKVITSIQSRLQIIKLLSISNHHIRIISENRWKENIVILPKAMEILFQLSLSLRSYMVFYNILFM